MTELDLVSVVLPVYNCEKYIADSINSILNQTYSNLELIIVNDASTDKTKFIIDSFIKQDFRIKYFENAINSGVSFSTNFAISKSKGTYIAKQDADDISIASRIEMQVNYFKNNSGIDVLTGRALFFDCTNNTKWISGDSLNHNQIKLKLLLGCPVMNPTLMIKKEFLNKHNLNYDICYNGPEDYDFFTRSVVLGKFCSLPNILIKYRIHDSINRLNHESKIDAYKLGTYKIRMNYFTSNNLNINNILVFHYENLFYNHIYLNILSLKKTILFYLKFKQAVLSKNNNELDESYINKQLNASFYNSYYQYSKIGFIAFSFYYKYSKQLGRFHIIKEIKFFVKCVLKK